MMLSFRPPAALAVALGFSLLTAAFAAARPMVVAYVPNWIDLKTFIPTIPFEKVTHLNVAFENPDDDSGTLGFSADYPTLIAKAHAFGVKVLISIGGGSASEDPGMQARYAALLSEEKRAGFAGKLVDYVKTHGFDGLDVDLEGPTVNQNYGPFITALGAGLKPGGKLLSAAVSKGYGGARVPAETFADFDFVNIMAYDATGYWDPASPGPHSSYAFAVDNISYWLERGLPRAKAVLGVPFYGHGFHKAFHKGVYDYARIVLDYPGAEERDESGSVIFYNGLPTIRKKCRCVLDENLAGVMIWSLDEDAPGPKSLLNAIHETLLPKP